MQTVDIYARVSTDDQEDNSSLDEQERACREYCQQNELEVGIVHREVWSGYQYRERQKLDLMRSRYRDGIIQGVVIRTLDRLSRSQVHNAILMEEMEHHQVALHCVKETIDDTPMGKFIRMVLAFVAEMEREKFMDRGITGRINAAKAGKIVGGKKPRYGWKWHDPVLKDYLVIDEEQAAIIRWTAKEYADGTTCVSLCHQLNERCIPAPAGNKVWIPRTLRRLLTDVRNTGKGARMFVNPSKKAKRNLDPVPLPDETYPALIDDETYQQILMRVKANKAEAIRNSDDPTQFLLRAGYVKCASCSRLMAGCLIRDTRASKPRYVYVCPKTHVCQGYRIPSKQLDDEVWGELVQLADYITLIEEAVQLASNQDNSAANLKAVERALAEWRENVDNYTGDLQDRTLKGPTRAGIRKLLNDANEMVERLEGEKQKILAGAYDRQREKETYGEILEWCRTVKTAREPLTYQKKRDFLRLLGVVVLVNRVPRKKGSDISYDIRLRLPALQELIRDPKVGREVEIVGQSRMKRR